MYYTHKKHQHLGNESIHLINEDRESALCFEGGGPFYTQVHSFWQNMIINENRCQQMKYSLFLTNAVPGF